MLWSQAQIPTSSTPHQTSSRPSRHKQAGSSPPSSVQAAQSNRAVSLPHGTHLLHHVVAVLVLHHDLQRLLRSTPAALHAQEAKRRGSLSRLHSATQYPEGVQPRDRACRLFTGWAHLSPPCKRACLQIWAKNACATVLPLSHTHSRSHTECTFRGHHEATWANL